MIVLSIVVPIYNESVLLNELFDRFEHVFKDIESSGIAFQSECELIFVNDGSTDDSLAQLIAYAQKQSHVRCVNLARNFGHQLAITAGLSVATGQAIVTMDGDLQHPPECIIALYKHYASGYDVVYALPERQLGAPWFKLKTAQLFYAILNKMSPTPIAVGDFRLVSRRVLDIMNQMPEQHRLLRGMTPWIGFKQGHILYQRDCRYAGKTKYSLLRMLMLSLDGITSFSSMPLRCVGVLGVLTSALGFIYGVYALYQHVFLSKTITGWTSLVLLVLLLGGVQLLCLGVIGEYIARIYEQSKQRPLYIIDTIYGDHASG
ncbi:glycosyltransferase [bacterium]|nr:glycosyltransferase [bacterium]